MRSVSTCLYIALNNKILLSVTLSTPYSRLIASIESASCTTKFPLTRFSQKIWPSFSRLHFQKHFHDWNVPYFDSKTIYINTPFGQWCVTNRHKHDKHLPLRMCPTQWWWQPCASINRKKNKFDNKLEIYFSVCVWQTPVVCVTKNTLAGNCLSNQSYRRPDLWQVNCVCIILKYG